MQFILTLDLAIIVLTKYGFKVVYLLEICMHMLLKISDIA